MALHDNQPEQAMRILEEDKILVGAGRRPAAFPGGGDKPLCPVWPSPC